MLTTVSLVSIQDYILFLEMRTFKIYSVSNFHIYNTALLTLVILYSTAHALFILLTGSFYPLTTFTHFTDFFTC